MIEIETYSDKYFLDVVKLIENFHKEAIKEYDSFDPVAVIEVIKTNKDKHSDTCFLLIIDGICQGILFGVTTKSLTGGKNLFQEIIWYVNEGFRFHGVRLLRHAEKVLKNKEYSAIIMAVLENSKTDKLYQFYERIGYRKIETHFMRTL